MATLHVVLYVLAGVVTALVEMRTSNRPWSSDVDRGFFFIIETALWPLVALAGAVLGLCWIVGRVLRPVQKNGKSS